MENGIRAPVSLWNRNTLDGFKEKCTDPASRSTGVSAVMMERTEGFSEQGWAEITLTSRPMTSTRLKLAAKGPFSVRMKPSGRIPTVTGWSGTPFTERTAWSPSHSVSFRTSPLNTFD